MGLAFVFGEESEDFFDIGAAETAGQLIARYRAALNERKRSKQHVDEVTRKLAYIFNNSEATPQKWGKRAMKAHIAMRRDNGMSDWTVKGDVVACKAFFKWLYSERYFSKDLLEGFEIPEVKSEVTDKTVASQADINGWLRANNEYYGDPTLMGKLAVAKKLTEGFRLRDQLFVCILADTGVRPVEATRIQLDQVKNDGMGTYIVLSKYQTKNGQGRKIYLSKTTVDLALTPFMTWRTLHKVTSPYLLPQGNSDKPLDPAKWGRQFSKKVAYGQKHGYISIDKKITPYSLKRYLVELVDKQSPRASRALVGHVGDDNTVHARYNQEVDKNTLDDMERLQDEVFVRTMHDKANPIGGLTNLRA